MDRQVDRAEWQRVVEEGRPCCQARDVGGPMTRRGRSPEVRGGLLGSAARVSGMTAEACVGGKGAASHGVAHV